MVSEQLVTPLQSLAVYPELMPTMAVTRSRGEPVAFGCVGGAWKGMPVSEMALLRTNTSANIRAPNTHRRFVLSIISPDRTVTAVMEGSPGHPDPVATGGT